ncbi:hypothetical protein SO802_022863 [Lithocarpus litseifolius]|uniref:Uncharacterized protein n=1 Tax=Lithocarpus litseifolius TaxID=425828 RepID=A0AAW2C812_9ROSI
MVSFKMIDIVDAASDQMEASKGVSLEEEEPANLVTSLRGKLDSLSSLSSQSCIYRIPKRLRKRNNEAYTPHIVSIGPLHHGSTDLQAMEEHKLRYLKDFLLYTKVSLEDYVKLLREREARIRNSYEETIKLGSDKFLEMILVDAAFVIEEPPPKGKLRTLSAPNATQLHQAGVRFKVGSPKNLFDIKFKNGILEISNIRIHDDTEAFFRNLIAFEQCHMRVDYISDYFIVLDRLIDTPNDVELLVQCGIIENWLPNSQMVVTLINNLVFGTVTSTANFYFANLLGELNAYCSVPWHKWKATLNEDYFSTPWAVISVSAATVLLILTLIQTVCSVISL